MVAICDGVILGGGSPIRFGASGKVIAININDCASHREAKADAPPIWAKI